MRRILCIVLALLCIASLVACGSKEETHSSTYEYTVASAREASTPAPEPSNSPTPEPEYNYLNDISEADIDSMSDATKAILRINTGIAIADKKAGVESSVEVSLGGLDRINLSSLSLEKLEWIQAYIESGKTVPQPQVAPEFDIDVYSENFTTDMRVQFCLFEAVQELSRSLGWYVTQNNNPEVSFDIGKQVLGYAHFYLDYYADCTTEEAKEAVEEYTDTLIDAIQYAFPDIQIDQLVFFWRIPAIDEDNLYAAKFFCDNDNGSITRGVGSGSIY